jgi:hypothetical protein
MNKMLLSAALITLVIGTAIFYFLTQQPSEPLPTVTTVAEPTAQPPQEPAIRYPLTEPETPTEPTATAQTETPPALPGIEAGDAVMHNLLDLLADDQKLLKLFLFDHFVQRLVVTIDNLPRKELAGRQLPLKSPAGSFLTQGELGSEIISPYNARRYAPYLDLAEKLDTKQLVSIYIRHYPLFQKAYADLGYPSGYFNDRLIEVIDHLLATPDIQPPIPLERPGVLYHFADAELENRSAGQKMLLRSGPENARKIKEKLSALRVELMAHSQRP